MKKLVLNFENCYGIKALSTEFDFENKSTYSVYSPNGVMKTSFAKVFNDFKNDIESKDLAFPARTTKRVIVNEDGDVIEKESILVIEQYEQGYQSDDVSRLLVSPKLKEEYTLVKDEIENLKHPLEKSLKQLSGLIGKGDDILSVYEGFFKLPFLDFISKYSTEINEGEKFELDYVKFSEIFNKDVIAFLKQKDFQKSIKEYIERYHELVEKSTFLKKNFNLSHISNIHKQLDSNNFFDVGNKVKLFDGKDIDTSGDLENIIEGEKEKILGDSDLKKKFEEISKKISNANLRKFRDYLLENQDILPQLGNLEKFKGELLFGYLIKEKSQVEVLVEVFKSSQKAISDIYDLAKSEKTDWERVVEIFNQRFIHLPFYLVVGNKEDVILNEKKPIINFIFKCGAEQTEIEEKDLLKILSTGEKRALYILNIMFEVEVRNKNNQDTIFIIDDIADSFDYKNKYAIIEYLKYISSIPYFNQIILTHNFDFYRTLHVRNIVPYNMCLLGIKSQSCIKLVKADFIRNPFVGNWKDNLGDDKKLIASIPFVRNLIEYTEGVEENEKYETLTSLLHIKSNTNIVTVGAVKEIFESTLHGINFPDKDLEDLFYDKYANAIQDCLDAEEGMNFENKIVLSIAIRLHAELFMKQEISDEAFLTDLESNQNQTWKLFSKYKKDFPDSGDEIRILERVNLIVPVNIHLNAFMYEPILDMGDNELRELYSELGSVLKIA